MRAGAVHAPHAQPADAGEQQRQLDRLLRGQHRLALRDPLHLLLEGDEPDRLARDATYLGYLTR